MIKNKRGDKILSVYWFAVLFIVAAAIVYMVVSFYGHPYDVRAAEANALTNKVADCLSTGGYFDVSVLKSSQKDFLITCGINFTTENIYNWSNDQFYLEVHIYNFSSGKAGNELFSTTQGNTNLRDSCTQPGPSMPVCIQRSFYSVDKDNNQYKINITSVVRKTEKNAV